MAWVQTLIHKCVYIGMLRHSQLSGEEEEEKQSQQSSVIAPWPVKQRLWENTINYSAVLIPNSGH